MFTLSSANWAACHRDGGSQEPRGPCEPGSFYTFLPEILSKALFGPHHCGPPVS